MMLDETFFSPRVPVSVVAIGEASEALLIRSLLEGLGATVQLHFIGTPADFLKVISQGDRSPKYLVISAHGDEVGFIFGAYGDDIDLGALHGASMPPKAIADSANLPGVIVVSTACSTGTKPFADAFLRGGVAAYIAAEDYPDGSDVPLFVHLLFHQMLARHQSPDAALMTVQKYDQEFCMFTHAAPNVRKL
ncbi:hypothetical protein DFI02_12037 [Rhizobium sp. PP-F2F-G20b]|nr:hypothetical protein DFI02_12037 [Rhizobium sp. PP-F2F-G20b]